MLSVFSLQNIIIAVVVSNYTETDLYKQAANLSIPDTGTCISNADTSVPNTGAGMP